jgi:hypothetical protein
MNWKLRGYLKETKRPIYSAALVLPFLCIYHIGTLVLRTTYINGADALIIRLLSLFSVNSMLGSVLVLLICFIVWQIRTRASWKIKTGMLLVSYLESACFALLLLFVFGWMTTHISLSAGAKSAGLTNLVLYCGAGVYEELVFRGFLLSVLIALFRRTMKSARVAVTIAAVAGALIFALFHYIGPAADPLSVSSFLQRTLAGLFFSAVFVTRGFGITAAGHAIYDIFVGLLTI